MSRAKRLPASADLAERLLSKTTRTPGGCWLWTASSSGPGYGRIQVDGVCAYAHRVSYEIFVGPIPEGLCIDHLCRTPACINPCHLEPVTNQENTLRGVGFAARNAVKTHCDYGHPFDAENTYHAFGRRYCRACNRRKVAEHYARTKAVAA